MAFELPAFPAARRPRIFPDVVTDRLAANHPLRGAVLALGNFDGFHLGHQGLVRMAREIAPGCPVALMSCEPHPRSFFGAEDRPFRLATRLTTCHQVAGYDVDFLYSPTFDRAFADLSPSDFVDRVLSDALGVRYVIAGPDFRFGRRRAGDMAVLAELCAAHGIGVRVASDVTHAGVRISSTLIRAAIQAGDLRGAAQLLGHGWIVETSRLSDGALKLHPTLCRPRACRYLGRAWGIHGWSEPMRIDISPEGDFTPLGPHSLRAAPDMWCLEAQVKR